MSGVVIVVFCDLVDSTTLLARLGDDRMEQIRRAHVGDAADVVAAGGGRVVKTFGDGAMARFDLQNAQGGVHGRRIELVPQDDQSNGNLFLTAAQDLVQNKKVFAVLPISSFTFMGAGYLSKQGIPVVGSAFDGPEWGLQPYSNMFSFIPPFSTTFAGKNYDYNFYGKFLKTIGVTKLAGVAYSISPSSLEAVHAILASAASAGVASCYTDYSVPFGAVDFTATALAVKNAGCNGTVAALVDSSNNALAQAETNTIRLSTRNPSREKLKK